VLVDQPAAAGVSRAAPEGHERGLEPGTSSALTWALSEPIGQRTGNRLRLSGFWDFDST
jgi:hypothetical protein